MLERKFETLSYIMLLVLSLDWYVKRTKRELAEEVRHAKLYKPIRGRFCQILLLLSRWTVLVLHHGTGIPKEIAFSFPLVQ